MIAERDLTAENPIIQLREVELNYPGSTLPSLSKINLDLYAREFVCVLGPSGCGKSTLLKLLAGFIQPTEGRVEFDHKPIKGPGWQRGVVFQQPALYPWLTVAENVEFGLRMRGVDKKDRARQASMVLEQVGLEDFRSYKPYELSGGMNQRVSIARALINQPRILLMDEPFGALDALTRERMQNFLRNIWSETNRTIFFITHDVDEALSLGTRVLVMSKRPGHILKEFPVTFTYSITGRVQDHIRYTHAFIELREELLSLLHGEATEYVI